MILAAGMLLFGSVEQGQSLLLRLQNGNSAHYEVRMTFDDGGQKIDLTGKAEDRITKVDTNGNFTNEHTLFGVKMKVDKQEIDVSDTKRQVTVMKPTGEIVELVGGSPQDARYAYVTMLVMPTEPVANGHSWTFDLSPKGGRLIKQEYTAVSIEKVGGFDAMKVRIKSWEASGSKPMKSEGSAWIGVTDGRLVKLDLVVDGVPLGDEGHPMKLTVAITRVP